MIVTLLREGALSYVVSADVRLWQNLFERPDGAMAFSFLQPTMAAIAAWRAGGPALSRLFRDE